MPELKLMLTGPPYFTGKNCWPPWKSLLYSLTFLVSKIKMSLVMIPYKLIFLIHGVADRIEWYEKREIGKFQPKFIV